MSEALHPWPHLEAPLLAVLRAHPEGLSEFDLIRSLQRDYELPEFGDDALRDPVSLYRTHFILFHVLYCLDATLTDSHVEVGCLRCRLRSTSSAQGGHGALDQADPVRAFYMERSNLDLDRDRIERLMGDFWRLIQRGDRRRESALASLGLRDPVSDSEIKAAYRRLVMAHHPDRGGDTQRIQEINDAMTQLGF
jgi:hypothetical protein